MECPKCHRNISDSATVCPYCHKVLSLVCPNCRTLGHSPVCENCGYIILEKCSKCGRVVSTSSGKCKCGFSVSTSVAYQECESDEFASLSIKFSGLKSIRRVLSSQELYSKFKIRIKNLIVSILKGIEGRIIVYGDTYVVNFNKELSFATSVDKAVRLALKVINSFASINLKSIEELGTPLKLSVTIVKKNAEDLLKNITLDNNVKLFTVKKDEKRYLRGMQIVLDQFVQDNISKDYKTDSLYSVEQNGMSVMFYEIILDKYILPPNESFEEKIADVKVSNIKKNVKADESEDLYGFKIFDINAKCKFEKSIPIGIEEIIGNNKIVALRGDCEYQLKTSDIVNYYVSKGMKVVRATCTEELNYKPWAILEQIFIDFYKIPSHSAFIDSNFEVQRFESIKQLIYGVARKSATSEDARFAYMEDFECFLASLKNCVIIIEDFEYIDDTTIQTLQLFFDRFNNANVNFVFITNSSIAVHGKLRALLANPNYIEIMLQKTGLEAVLSTIKEDASDFINSFYYEKLKENFGGSKLYFDNAIAYLKEKDVLISFEDRLLIKSNNSVILPFDIKELLRARFKHMANYMDASMILAYSVYLGQKLDFAVLETLGVKEIDKNAKILQEKGFVYVESNCVYINNYNLMKQVIQMSLKPEIEEYLCKNIIAKIGKGLNSTLILLLMGKLKLYKDEYLLLWKNSQFAMSVGDYDAYLKNCLGCLSLAEHIEPAISEEEIENNKKEVYQNILMSLYGYSPEKIYSIENVLLMDAIKEDDNEKIVKLSNLMLQGALLSSNYTDALTLLHNILTRMPNPTLIVDGAINTRFLLLSLVNIEILFNIGEFRNCIEIAQELLSVIRPEIIEKIKPVNFSTNLFVSHMMETFRLVGLAKLIVLDSGLDEYFAKINIALGAELPDKDAIVAIKEFIDGASFAPSNIEDASSFSKLIYLILQEFETHKNDNKVFAQNIYQAKLLASDIHQKMIEMFSELLIADSYAKEGAKHKAAVIYNDILQKSENSAMYIMILLAKYFIARLEILKSNVSEALQIINDALALIQNNDNQAKVFYILFEKMFIELAKNGNISSIDIKSEEQKLAQVASQAKLKRLI
ncbi:zinc ribbon domain-containing protein [bacterium]|nr:zinc ribbon domain-containing protein [bacterium]